MSDDTWKRDEIESPCINVCVIHPEARICIGCHRTGDEIAGWSRMAPEERRRIMATLSDRSELLKRRSGGRAGKAGRRRRTAG